jgi:hypothetical protein
VNRFTLTCSEKPILFNSLAVSSRGIPILFHLLDDDLQLIDHPLDSLYPPGRLDAEIALVLVLDLARQRNRTAFARRRHLARRPHAAIGELSAYVLVNSTIRDDILLEHGQTPKRDGVSAEKSRGKMESTGSSLRAGQ